MPEQNLISVVIINYNGKAFLEKCFSSLLKTNYEKFEVIFVDNASTDGSVEYVVEKFKDKRILIVQNDKNYGVAEGRNVGFKKTKGEYVVFLDNDTEVDKEWLANLIKAFKSDSKIAVTQCKLLNMTERKKFDHAGDYLTPFGILFERSNQGIDTGQFDRIENIFSAKGAATGIKSLVFKELGMYDSSYFMYLEETDFCFRAWLSGYRVVFVPDSLVWHAFNTSFKKPEKYYSSYVIRFYGCRNYITTLLKNLSLGNLIKILPLHVLSWFILSLVFLLKGKIRDSIWIAKGILWNLFNLPSIFKKRVLIQKRIRKVKDCIFFKEVMLKQPLKLYFKKAHCYLSGKPFNDNFNNIE